MTASKFHIAGAPQYFLTYIHGSPFLSLLAVVASVCVFTRFLTGIRNAISQTQVDKPQKRPITVPYWVPFVGSAVSFATDIQGTITKGRWVVKFPLIGLMEVLTISRDSTGDGIVAYSLGPSQYYVLHMPSLVKQVFAKKLAVLNKEKILIWFMKVTFGDGNAARDEPHAFHEGHKVLDLMLRDKWISDATTRTARTIEDRASSLISLSSQSENQHVWERLGKVEVVDKNTADANFYALIVNFVGDIITPLLFGRAFMDNYPQCLEDLWIFDSGVHHLITSLLAVTPTARRATAARTRMLSAVSEWHDALAATQRGEDPGPKWSDMSDVSEIMQIRIKEWEAAKASTKLHTTNDMSVLWGANANSNKNIFWMLLQIYSRPPLLSAIRAEISPYVRAFPPPTSSHPGAPLRFDVDGLTKSCPLIKATFYETMRSNMSGLGIRSVAQDLTLTESSQDALLFGKKQPQSYRIPAGSVIALSNGTMQQDPRLFSEPHTFDPNRFLFPREDDPSKKQALMKNLNSFGGGTYKCKGRTFAEKEMLLFVAGILVLWDLEMPDGGAVRIPEMGLAGASRSPKEDVRVRLRRREIVVAPS